MNTRPDLWPGYLSALWSLMSLALLLIGAASTLADGRAQESSAEWTPDEQLVLRNTAADQPTVFDEKKPGNLRSTFLQKLLTGRLKESRDARYIEIQHARVTGDLDISYSDVKPFVHLMNCTFEGSVDFSWSSFAKGLNLFSGDFKKNVTFWGLEAKGPFRCRRAKFSGEGTVNMRSLRVDHVVDFRRAVFHPEADFAFSRVGDIYCGDATFYQKARFDHMRIEGDASFDTTTFDGPVKFEHSYVGAGLELDGTYFNWEQVPKDEECRCLIDMTNLIIKGTLTFTPRKWPTQGILQTGIEYTSWAPHNLDPLELLKGAEFDPQVYTNLENILRSTGRVDEADKVGMAKKSEERSRLKWKWISTSYWRSVLLYLFVGNGYRPGRALVWSIVVVLFGVLLFQERRMVPQTQDAKSMPSKNIVERDYDDILEDPWTQDAKSMPSEESHPSRRYSPVWYSLDLFVPAINLETAQFWMPASNQRFLLFWMRVQRILGWIIVPIGLLVISGLVKP